MSRIPAIKRKAFENSVIRNVAVSQIYAEKNFKKRSEENHNIIHAKYKHNPNIIIFDESGKISRAPAASLLEASRGEKKKYD